MQSRIKREMIKSSMRISYLQIIKMINKSMVAEKKLADFSIDSKKSTILLIFIDQMTLNKLSID